MRSASVPDRASSSAGGTGFAGVFQGQGVEVDDGVLHGDDQPFNEIFQLADVAGPVILLQKGRKTGTEGEAFAIFPAKTGQELVGQRKDILFSLPAGAEYECE